MHNRDKPTIGRAQDPKNTHNHGQAYGTQATQGNSRGTFHEDIMRKYCKSITLQLLSMQLYLCVRIDRHRTTSVA